MGWSSSHCSATGASLSSPLLPPPRERRAAARVRCAGATHRFVRAAVVGGGSTSEGRGMHTYADLFTPWLGAHGSGVAACHMQWRFEHGDSALHCASKFTLLDVARAPVHAACKVLCNKLHKLVGGEWRKKRSMWGCARRFAIAKKVCAGRAALALLPGPRGAHECCLVLIYACCAKLCPLGIPAHCAPCC